MDTIWLFKKKIQNNLRHTVRKNSWTSEFNYIQDQHLNTDFISTYEQQTEYSINNMHQISRD